MSPNKWETFRKSYREEEIKYMLGKIKSGDSILVVSFPGCGKSTLLRYLAESAEVAIANPNIKFIYVDLNQLPRFEPLQLYKLILKELNKAIGYTTNVNTDEELVLIDQIKDSVSKAVTLSHKVVLMLDRFNRVITSFPHETFNTLRSLSDDFIHSLMFIVATPTDPLNLTHLSKIASFYKTVVPSTLYVKPFLDRDCVAMIRGQIRHRGMSITKQQQETILTLSGGHSTIAKSIVRALEDAPQMDLTIENVMGLSSIRICLHEITESLNIKDLRVARDVTEDRSPSDETSLRNLINLGIVRTQEGKLTIFSPVFSKHLKTLEIPRDHRIGITDLRNVFEIDSSRNTILKKEEDISQTLTKQETDLMRYLIVNNGRVCERDEIASVIWGKDSIEGVSDEAIDQVVSRLRSKIEDSDKPTFLLTLRGIGFKFNNPIS